MKSLFFAAVTLLLFIACTPRPASQEPSSSPDDSTPDASLTETYWKLVQMNGFGIPPPPENVREIHLILHRTDSTITGNAGCNQFGGKYAEEPGNRLRFFDVYSTKMACDRLDLEQKFNTVLEQTDNFAIKGDTLSLHKAKMAPLARFEAVYLK